MSAIADRDQLERGFRRLEPEERAVIVLHLYLDLPLPEVAATLRIPLGTAKSRLYRGLGPMRAALDADARPGPAVRDRTARHDRRRRRFRPHRLRWLHEDAEHRVPDHLDAVLRRTQTERQRPAWSSLERWLPVQTTLRLAPGPEDRLAPRGPRPGHRARRGRLVVGLAGIRPAPPFGPARNGAIVFGGPTTTSTPWIRRLAPRPR